MQKYPTTEYWEQIRKDEDLIIMSITSYLRNL